MDVDYGALSGIFRPDKLVLGLIIIAAAFVLSRFLTQLLDKWGEGQARRRLVLKRVASIMRFAIFIFAAGLVVTNVLNLSDDAMLALGGTMAVTIGFALKDTAASLISGLLILVDQPFQVGDRVAFGGYYGEVKEIGLRIPLNVQSSCLHLPASSRCIAIRRNAGGEQGKGMGRQPAQ